MGRLNCLEISVGCGYALCRCEQWQTLIDSPRRSWLAQSFLREWSPRRPECVLSEHTTRPGERGLAWARSRDAFLLLFEPSPRRRGIRLSELASPERDPSAWARGWARQCCDWMSVCSWMICFSWVWLYDEWCVCNRARGMFDMIHEFCMTGWVWYWHVKWMSGLELKEHVIDMRWGPRFMGWWWSEVWIQNVMRMRNKSHGRVWNCKHVFDVLLLLFYECWSVSACNSLGSLGETSGATLQWSGRNPMAPVSGCPWWCPICITR